MENKENKGIFVRIYEWFQNLTLKGLLGAILIAFVIIIILFSLSFLPAAISKVSSSLSAALYSVFVPTENATMTVDNKIVDSGEDFTINFKRGELKDGFFTISYTCDAGAELLSIESNGLKKVDCDTRYYLLDNDTSIKVRAITQESVVRLIIDGAFENNETQKIEKVGVTRVTIKNDTVGTITNNAVVANSTTTPANTETVISTYYGKPDLAVRVLQVGLLNQVNNIVNNQNQFRYSDMVGVRFEVRNDGGSNTGPWSFTAVLPSLSTPNYNSNTQISLKPGESIIFTLGFTNLTNTRIGLISVNVDPLNIINESIEYNNILAQTITNNSYGDNYYNNNNYSNSGCYVNGIFTYNCFVDNYYDDLEVSCYGTPSNPSTGDRVRWYVEVTGGDGDYSYEWTGTNGLDSSSKNPTKTYSSRGTKYAEVTVESDGESASDRCSVYVD